MKLQWGHAFSGVETKKRAWRQAKKSFCFNGATPFQAWKREDDRHHHPGPDRFNGATPFQAWKPYSSRGLPRPSSIASMGPRLFRRGNPGWPGCIHRRPRWLQWGHAFSGVETSGIEPSNQCRPQSFNGATPFQAWKRLGRVRDAPISVMLQWGHAFSGVETLYAVIHEPNELTLQWGHAFSGVETLGVYMRKQTTTTLQWGHAFSGVETRRETVRRNP